MSDKWANWITLCQTAVLWSPTLSGNRKHALLQLAEAMEVDEACLVDEPMGLAVQANEFIGYETLPDWVQWRKPK